LTYFSANGALELFAIDAQLSEKNLAEILSK